MSGVYLYSNLTAGVTIDKTGFPSNNLDIDDQVIGDEPVRGSSAQKSDKSSSPSGLYAVVSRWQVTRGNANDRMGLGFGCGITLETTLDTPRRTDGGVDAGDGGVCVGNVAPGDFDITQPANNSQNVPLRPTIRWNGSADPEGGPVRYTVLIDENSDFSSAVTYDASGLTEYALTDPLSANTTYYVKAVARDNCDNVTESTNDSLHYITFTTANTDYCSREPGDFSLLSPANNAVNVSITAPIVFDWGNSIDPDATNGDSVLYRLEIDTSGTGSFTNPIVISGLTDSTYTFDPSGVLQYGQTVHWRVVAVDDCDNEVASTEVWSFETEKQCIPQTVLETDFTTGDSTNLDKLTYPGSIIADREWTEQYKASPGIFPNWNLTNPGGTIEVIQDPISSELALHINSYGTDGQVFYEFDPQINNATGWAIAWRSRLEALEAGSSRIRACMVGVVDTVKWLRLGLLESSIEDEITTNSYAMNTTDQMHNYKIEAQGNNYTLYVDGLPVTGSPWTFGGGDVMSRIRWGDYAGIEDSNSYWVYFKYYNQGTSVPFISPAEYLSEVYDLGTSNNLGDGSTLTYNGNIPAQTNIVFETRSGNTFVPDGSWSSWQALSGNQIVNPNARYLQVRTVLNTSNNTATAQLDDYQIDYCNY